MHEKICNGEEPFQYLIGTTKLQLSIVSDHAKDPHYCLRRYPPLLPILPRHFLFLGRFEIQCQSDSVESRALLAPMWTAANNWIPTDAKYRKCFVFELFHYSVTEFIFLRVITLL